jgi:predicted metal-dependent hydrolase
MTRADATILQGGRRKAYRPIPEAQRRGAIDAGLAAYAAGDWFLAHELLEPAWMGTRDVPERELLQGLIKLAAAFVHGARSNPAGVVKNLHGARARVEAGLSASEALGVDGSGLLASIDRWLVAPGGAAIEIPRLAAGAPTRREEEPPLPS